MIDINPPKNNLLKRDCKIVQLPKQSKKRLSHPALVRKLDTLFSKWIRLRDKVGETSTGASVCRCCTCGRHKEDSHKRIHAGHFQKRDNWATRYDEKNVHAQCHKCNTFEGGRDFEFGLYIDKKHGPGTAERLYIKAKLPCKWDRVELEEMINKYQKKLKDGE